MITENGHFTGGIPSSKDDRDYTYTTLGSATIPFDWDTGFDIEKVVGTMPVKDQLQSYSCGGQAWASYSYALDTTNREEKSAKYIYCQTHIGHGGSAGRDNCGICKTQGVATEALCASSPAIESFMTTDDRTPEAIADAKTNKEKYYAMVNKNIEEVAQAIRDCNGVVLGIYGQNNGTWLSKYPVPPQGSDVWAHWVYAGKAVLINGKKYIGFLNSWGKGVGEKGWQYVSEDYFSTQWGFFEIWSMTYDPQIVPPVVMPTLKLGSKGDVVKVLQKALGINADGIFGKMTQASLVAFQKAHKLVADGICGKATWAILSK